MKILHYINNLGSGGAEKLITDILPRMKEQGNIVHLAISNSNASLIKYEQKLLESGVKIINFKKSFYNPYQVIQLILILRKENYDIVHAHLFPTQYWLAIASIFKPKKTKLIKTEHSVYNERKNYNFLRPIEKFIYSRYSKIICITTEVKNNLKKWLENDSNFIVINNGVNINEFKFDFARQESVKNVYNNEFINILMVGRFDGVSKDQKTLLKALHILPNKYKVYFAGQGKEIDNIKKFTKDNNLCSRVVFLGLRNDINCLMNGADINVLSTNFEGLSGVTLESLASGKPFLGSDVVGVNTIVPNKNFLFQKGNYEELAYKIILISKDEKLRQKMSSQAINFVKDFDIEIMVKKYLELYD